MMPTGLLLLLYLTGHVFAGEQPDVDCLVVNLKYVHCSWNKQGTPEVNYTFYSGFQNDKNITECATYLSENNTNTGCNQPYLGRIRRFYTFYTKLVHGSSSFQKEHDLKRRVKLNPPTNLTVKMVSNHSMCFYWTQAASECVESHVRFRMKKTKQETTFKTLQQRICVRLPLMNFLYELQVQSKLAMDCGGSIFWSDWSEPLLLRSKRRTDHYQTAMQILMVYVLGSFTLLVLFLLFLNHKRIASAFQRPEGEVSAPLPLSPPTKTNQNNCSSFISTGLVSSEEEEQVSV